MHCRQGSDFNYRRSLVDRLRHLRRLQDGVRDYLLANLPRLNRNRVRHDAQAVAGNCYCYLSTNYRLEGLPNLSSLFLSRSGMGGRWEDRIGYCVVNGWIWCFNVMNLWQLNHSIHPGSN